MHDERDGERTEAIPERALALLAALAEEKRLRVFAAVVLGSRTEVELCSATGLTSDEVGRAVKRLAMAGLVGIGREGIHPHDEALSDIVREARDEKRRRGPSAAELGATPAQEKVLDRYLRHGRLESIPTRGEKRAVVLDFLAGHFRPGSTYAEAEVNEMLARFHSDTASLRRYLVDDGFLERRDGRYWRAGGTFEVD